MRPALPFCSPNLPLKFELTLLLKPLAGVLTTLVVRAISAISSVFLLNFSEMLAPLTSYGAAGFSSLAAATPTVRFEVSFNLTSAP